MRKITDEKPLEPTAGPAPGERLLSRRQLGERWGCCPETIKRMEGRGLLKPVRFNSRNLRYHLADILAVERQAAGQTGKEAAV